MGNLLKTIALLLALTAPASAAYHVTGDFGGSIGAYVEKYNAVREAGGKVIVEDFCVSACTLVFRLIPARDVCVLPSAMFGFHSATEPGRLGQPVYSVTGTAMMWESYPEYIQEKLRKKGWDGGEHPGVIFIKGTELYPLCHD